MCEQITWFEPRQRIAARECLSFFSNCVALATSVGVKPRQCLPQGSHLMCFPVQIISPQRLRIEVLRVQGASMPKTKSPDITGGVEDREEDRKEIELDDQQNLNQGMDTGTHSATKSGVA